MILTTFAVFTRIAANSLLNAGQKKLAAGYPSAEINFKTYFILSILTLPLLFIFYLILPLNFPRWSTILTPKILLWAAIGGIFGALGNAFLIAALKRGELSVLGPVNSYKAIVGLIFGIFLIKEIPGTTAIFGIILIILGSYFIFDTTKEGFHLSLFKRKDIQYRILALIFTAIEAVFIKKVIILSDAFCSFLLWVVFGCVFSFAILKKDKKPVSKDVIPFLPLAFLVFIMQLSTNYVFVKLPVAAALSLFQLSNILNVFLGYKMFMERQLLKKLAGSIIMIIGSILIILKG